MVPIVGQWIGLVELLMSGRHSTLVQVNGQMHSGALGQVITSQVETSAFGVKHTHFWMLYIANDSCFL